MYFCDVINIMTLRHFRSGGFLKSIATSGLTGELINGTGKNPHSLLKTSLPIESIIRCPEGTSITEYQLLRLDEKKDRREFRAIPGGVVNLTGGKEKNAAPFHCELSASCSEETRIIIAISLSPRLPPRNPRSSFAARRGIRPRLQMSSPFCPNMGCRT
jgi:hypothetical protein